MITLDLVFHQSAKIASLLLLLLLFLFLLHRERGLIFLVLLCLIMLIAFKMQRFSMNDVDNGIVSVFRCCYCLHSDQEIKMLGNYTVSDERLVIESSKFVWKGKLRVRSKCSWFVNC